MASKVAWEIGDETEPTDSDLTSFYQGPVPPAGNYLCTMKWLGVKLQKGDVPRWHGPCEISEPEGSPNEQYNGYTIWIGQGFEDHPRSKAHIRSLALALGATWNDVLRKTVTDLKRGEDFSYEKRAEILRIGPVEIGDNELVVVTQAGTDQNDNPRLEPAQYLPPEEYEEAEWDEEEEDEAPPPPRKRAAKKAAPEPEPEEDEEEYEEEEEPEPPKRRPAKKAAKKAPAKPILDDEVDFEEEEDDEEEAPPPRKRAAKKAPAKKAAAKKAPSRRRAAEIDDNDPPF